jgi:hypothetical protein
MLPVMVMVVVLVMVMVVLVVYRQSAQMVYILTYPLLVPITHSWLMHLMYKIIRHALVLKKS